MTSSGPAQVLNHIVNYSEAPLDSTFGALSDATRRGILARLAQHGKASIGELAAHYKISLFAANGNWLLENSWEIPAAWKTIVKEGRVAEWRVYCDNDPARKIMAANAPAMTTC